VEIDAAASDSELRAVTKAAVITSC
jgi:hypothetical protein